MRRPSFPPDGNIIKWELNNKLSNKNISGYFTTEFNGNIDINRLLKEIRRIPVINYVEKI